MGPRHFSDWVRLPDDEKILYFSDKVFRVPFDGAPESRVSRMWNIEIGKADKPNDQEVRWVSFVAEQRCADKIVVQCGHCLTREHVAKFHERRLILRFQHKGSTEIKLRHMVILLILLSIVIDQCTTHAEIGYDGGMLLLVMNKIKIPNSLYIRTEGLAEYSHSTKLLVSFKLKSLVLCSPSPTLPPLPNFRPALSFFFFAVRTLLKRSSMFEGNCKAGRWKERASCLDRRVLYCGRLSGIQLGQQERHLRMAVAAFEPDMHARQQVGRRFDERGDGLLLL